MIGIKSVLKTFAVAVICLCAVWVCTMFLSYDIDLRAAEGQVSAQARPLYEAQLVTSKVVCIACGVCLATSATVVLVAFIKAYVQSNCKQLGILKALGYSPFQISLRFWKFGLGVLVGCALGFAIASAVMPAFYSIQSGGQLPQIAPSFHPLLALALVVLPAPAFGAIAVLSAYSALKKPALALIKGQSRQSKIRRQKGGKDVSFLQCLAVRTAFAKKSHLFLIVFACFCYGSMVPMAMGMKEVASEMMAYMIFGIGVLLAVVIMLLSVSAVVGAKARTIALMKAEGYAPLCCTFAVLGGFTPFALLGFVLGAVYQHVLLRIMVTVVFAEVYGVVPEYAIRWGDIGIAFATFVALYTALIAFYAFKIRRAPLKKIMEEV